MANRRRVVKTLLSRISIMYSMLIVECNSAVHRFSPNSPFTINANVKSSNINNIVSDLASVLINKVLQTKFKDFHKSFIPLKQICLYQGLDIFNIRRWFQPNLQTADRWHHHSLALVWSPTNFNAFNSCRDQFSNECELTPLN